MNHTISAILFQDLRKYHIDFCESAKNFYNYMLYDMVGLITFSEL